ncbi:protein DDI1 homolog 2-like isoform X2 [Mya arenaria]|uniref:protein DDI1 homolog 2-like isoform X2 n=2 Tax=Mya arenaria TaxID=6604 RepID=UPI0022E14251|nr:protein DDI1 homolog 2-like isoform X2 [Mya arenaria]XP_052759815.1 protein DDI1 homolog 2-like isoform X2 [Mya arenaria]
MNLTITTLDDRLISIEVGEDLELENLKAQCEFELGVPVQRMVLTWNGKPLNDNKKTLKQYGIGNGEMLLLQQINPSSQASQPRQSGSGASGGVPMIDFGSIAIPGNPPPPRPDLEDPLVILELIKNNPHERALLKERNPPLSDALESGNTGRFIEVYTKQRNERLKREEERNKMISMDPFSSEAQRLIAEEIRMKNVETNMESAIEHVPESFGQVVMLYVNCIVNGHPVQAFVDSGAQMTIMSQSCAERCNIMRLVDMRWAGIAKGVGTQKIIGRVHLGMIQIESDFLQSSFSILEDQPMDMLLGLDMLKRHQCVIDLQKNELLIGTTGTRTPFLAENQLPSYARINREPGSESGDEELAKALQKSADEAADEMVTSRCFKKRRKQSQTRK